MIAIRRRWPLAVPLLGAILLLGAAPAAVRAAAAPISDDYACSLCHLSKVKGFRKPGATPLVANDALASEPSGRQNPASTPRMCFSCHDGYVRDSRVLWRDGAVHAHRLGMVPSSAIARPEGDDGPLFPVNEDGKVYCGSCHTAHAGEDGNDKLRTFVRGRADGALCVGCHETKASVAGSSHDKSRGGALDFEASGLCGTCHQGHIGTGALLWARTPGPDGPGGTALCRSCHRSGDPDRRIVHPAHVAVWSPALRAGLRDGTPPEMPVFDHDGRMARFGSIACATCHEPHSPTRPPGAAEEDSDGAFLRARATAGFLCADCHGSRAPYLYRFFHSARVR
jgi:predicted CXXCH cytochrome family protein